jgi:bifunctional enzyme CysN/CysC
VATTDTHRNGSSEFRDVAAGRLAGTAGGNLAGQQRPAVIWLTGRSGAGKSTIAGILESRLRELGASVGTVDGDDLRGGLCSDLGFSERERAENVRRAAEVAHIMVRSGLLVIVSLISPFRDARATARALFGPGEFFEVYVDTPAAVAEWRDPKGLYRRARNGEIPQFTGIDSPYEAPDAPELRLDTVSTSAEECAELVIGALIDAGALDRHSGDAEDS